MVRIPADLDARASVGQLDESVDALSGPQRSIFTARGEEHSDRHHWGRTASMYSESIAPESACTGMHRITTGSPTSSPRTWNAAQGAVRPQLALGANSLYFFGHQLWAETPSNCSWATDTRPEELKSQGVRPRVWFGERWITSIFDLFEENVRYFPRRCCPRCPTKTRLPNWQRAAHHGYPELRLHNGTVYRWGTGPSTTSSAKAPKHVPTCVWRIRSFRPAPPSWT